MHAPAWQALRALSSRSQYIPCRYILGRRYCITRRSFRTSPSKARDQDPSEVPESAYQHVADLPAPLKEDAAIPEAEEVTEAFGGAPEPPTNGKDRSGYGSATRRAGRNVKRREVPPPQLPQWFLDRNVYLREDKAGSGDRGLDTLQAPEATVEETNGDAGSISRATQN